MQKQFQTISDGEHSFRQIGEGIFCLGQRKGGRVHAYLLDDGEKLTLIDTLFDKDGEFVITAIESLGREIYDLKNIIITHGHRSHLGGLAALKAKSGARVWAHEWESDIIAGDRYAQGISIVPRWPLRVYHLQLGLAFGLGWHPPCEVDEFLKEGDPVGPLQVIHAPGHSPGHLALFWRKNRALFAGDAIATWPGLCLGWPAFNLNKVQHHDTLLKLDDLGAEMIAVGHGEPATGEQVAQLRTMIRSVPGSSKSKVGGFQMRSGQYGHKAEQSSLQSTTGKRRRMPRKWRPSLGGRLMVWIYSAVNAGIPWYRLPKILGVFNVYAIRTTLREKNLFHPALEGQDGEKVSESPPLERFAFRTSNGQFNDLGCPMMGAAQTRFGRNFPLDKVHPEKLDKLLQPNPRLISQRLLARTEFKPAKTLNLLALAWIQYQVHDWVDHGDNEPDRRYEIPLPPDDDWHENPMRIKRTKTDPTRTAADDEANLPPTFINMASHWWDGSATYGSYPKVTDHLRLRKDGKLRMENDRLPLDPGSEIVSTGFTTNWWIGLEILHTIFALEHNAICDRLKLEFPNWSDEQLFQTARLINAALVAKIHTVEWTPALLANPTLQFGMKAIWGGLAGERLTRLLGRVGTGDVISGIPGTPQDHQDVPFSLTEEFVSVYRMHSLLPDEIKFWSLTNRTEPKVLPMEAVLREKSHDVIGKDLTFADALYSFGIAHPGALTLQNFPNFLRKLKVPPPDASSEEDETVDLGAIDILRDRERGVPRYNEFRRLLRLKPARSIEELTDNVVWQKELRDIYEDDVERVDLLVGMHAETPPPKFGISETAFRIFILMANRRIKSDRFFTDDYTARIYTQVGLDWIGNNDMVSVLLRHYPELKPTLWHKENAFQPWQRLPECHAPST